MSASVNLKICVESRILIKDLIIIGRRKPRQRCKKIIVKAVVAEKANNFAN